MEEEREPYGEKKRERRRRDFRRMVGRAQRLQVRCFEALEPPEGQDWAEVYALAWQYARRMAENLKSCSCFYCRSQRRWGCISTQEGAASLTSREQLAEMGLADEVHPPGRIARRRRRLQVRSRRAVLESADESADEPADEPADDG